MGTVQRRTKTLKALSRARLDATKQYRAKVSKRSTINIQSRIYSVDSRLRDEYVQVFVYANHLDVLYAQKKIDTLPRLHGKEKHHIQYRHIIDSLIRKPGAFENYRYKKDLFPTHRFRVAYDILKEQKNNGNKEYLKILHLAAKESEIKVNEALNMLLKENVDIEELKLSRLPLEKNLQSFDRQRLPMKINAQLSALLDGSFLDRKENVLAFGNPGSGKTHLLCAIGQELIHQGYKIIFKPCSLLVQELLIAKNELRLEKTLKQLSRFDALIIDDIGYVQYDRYEMEVLFTLLAERYERKSVMLTSNLPFSKWEQIFKDPMTTAAAIDRVVHHSIILELNLPSYRLEESKKSKTKKSKPDPKGNFTKG